MKPTTRHIPQNSIEIIEGKATIYLYTNRNGKPCAIAYYGNSGKPVFNYSFPNDEGMIKFIEEKLEAWRESENIRAAWKAEKQGNHSLRVGDILVASWGYEQTNVDFFQVTAVTDKTVTFGEIGCKSVSPEGFMSDTVEAVKDNFKDEKRYTRHADGKNQVSFADHPGGYMLHLHKWDGKPESRSWYG